VITVPWVVTPAGLSFCNLVQLVTYPEKRDSISLKVIDGDCAVTIRDNSNTIFSV
jgi:hypothetical protein